MLEIVIPRQQPFINEEFIDPIPETKLQLEHSLISLKKWESKWHKPFLEKDDKTMNEICDYIRCMTINQVADKRVYNFMPVKYIKQVINYINDPMTATTISEGGLPKTSGPAKKFQTITNEIIYYWMISLNIPMECQKWHLNQLLTLIKVVNIKNGPKRKMNRKEEMRQRTALNEARKAKYKTKG